MRGAAGLLITGHASAAQTAGSVRVHPADPRYHAATPESQGMASGKLEVLRNSLTPCSQVKVAARKPPNALILAVKHTLTLICDELPLELAAEK